MKWGHKLVATMALVVSLGIFVLYRSEDCAVNLIVNATYRPTFLATARKVCLSHWPTSEFFVYQLPGGLWVLAATIVSWNVRVKTGNLRLDTGYLPLIVAISFEVFQLLGITDGTYDPGDVLAACLGFCVAGHLRRETGESVILTSATGGRWIICLGSYLILFLADHYL